VQLLTYLVCVALFSISFLVFVNSTASFFITDRIGLDGDVPADGGRSHAQDSTRGVGNAVGTLGFADEIVAIVACPLWGVLSDRIGVRAVVTLGYLIIAASLLLFLLAANVFPQLLMARMLFSVGAAAV